MTNEAKYDKELEAYRAVARDYIIAQDAYEDQRIGDTEFLAARKALDEASIKLDAVEATL